MTHLFLVIVVAFIGSTDAYYVSEPYEVKNLAACEEQRRIALQEITDVLSHPAAAPVQHIKGTCIVIPIPLPKPLAAPIAVAGR